MNTKAKLEAMREIEAANDARIDEWQQKKEQITGVLIDVANSTAYPVTMDKDLDAYYEALNCDCIDIAQRRIGSRIFDIICDDNGALLDDAIPSAVDQCGRIHLYGNLFVVAFDGVDSERSLTPDEIALVMCHVRPWISRAKPEGYKLLWGVGF